MRNGSLVTHRWSVYATVALVAVLLVVLFNHTFQYLYANWQREEYSHGFLIPPLVAYLLWQRRDEVGSMPLKESWAGFALVLLGLGLLILNLFTAIVGADAYALVIVIVGAVLAALGWKAFRVVFIPIALLFLMNPLPTFWYSNLSSKLQLLSSSLGVELMRLFGISVFLEGNVIDLGTYQLQVAEACSGLRYLFPLMTLGAVIAYLFKGRPWARVCVFLSAGPITVLMNSLRIGLIGVLVDRFGIAQAEGFLHQFEGWAIFMVCFAVLLLECLLLMRISGDRRTFRQAFGLERASPPARSGPEAASPARFATPVRACVVALALAVYPSFALPHRAEIGPPRADFSQFPLHLAGWVGQRSRIEQQYLDVLQLDDYLLADFLPQRDPSKAPASTAPVNLYVAYYASQRTGRSIHSPSSCLPGGGWRIESFEQRQIPAVTLHSAPLTVNRAVISQGNSRQLVYYWFAERGRDLTNEYAVKWYLFADALIRARTDGALVRVITPLVEGETAGAADLRLTQFSSAAVAALNPYLPD